MGPKTSMDYQILIKDSHMFNQLRNDTLSDTTNDACPPNVNLGSKYAMSLSFLKTQFFPECSYVIRESCTERLHTAEN